MFLNNKYKRWYYQIVNRARKRGVPEGYFEKHHVIPRCMGGKNDFWNIVNLTYREHYIVHWLLTKFTEGEILRKMNYALASMGCCDRDQVRNIPSRWYERSRRAFVEAQIGSKQSKWAKLKR